MGSALSARFSGPYEVLRKLSDTDYVIRTPDRRRKSRVCHINMLKGFHDRESLQKNAAEPDGNAVSALRSVAACGHDEAALLMMLILKMMWCHVILNSVPDLRIRRY